MKKCTWQPDSRDAEMYQKMGAESLVSLELGLSWDEPNANVMDGHWQLSRKSREGKMGGKKKVR